MCTQTATASFRPVLQIRLKASVTDHQNDTEDKWVSLGDSNISATRNTTDNCGIDQWVENNNLLRHSTVRHWYKFPNIYTLKYINKTLS